MYFNKWSHQTIRNREMNGNEEIVNILNITNRYCHSPLKLMTSLWIKRIQISNLPVKCITTKWSHQNISNRY